MRRNKIIVILGRKGSGKTFLANVMSKKIDRVILIDPLNNFKGGHIFFTFNEFKFNSELLFREKFRIVLKFTTDEEYIDFFDYIFNFHHFTLVVDEADIFAGSKSIDREFKRLFSYGRHRNIDIIITARRPYELNRLITSQADILITFKQTEQRDLDYLAKLGFDPNEVKSLSKYQYIMKENE
ncbi:MAG: hypothetical protein ACTSVV_14435 [Promethearchaeota archaeon]